MPIRANVHNRTRSQDGVALVMVLAFIVLLAILIVAFVSSTGLNRRSTASYSKSIQAQEIAQGGLQDILTDVHSEIIAGSTVYSTNASGVAYANSYANAYIPTANSTAVPARLGYASTLFTNAASATLLPSTLIRVSRASQDGTPTHLYPSFTAAPYSTYYTDMAKVNGGAILNRASAVNSSTNYSVDGRYISPARWNKPYLLGATTLTAGGAGLQIPAAFATNTPDWVYVTRTGSRVCQNSELTAGTLSSTNSVTKTYTFTAGSNPPASPVVGRYAYVMYDEGALLDANVAGYPAAATNLVSGVPPVGTSTITNPASISQMVLGKSYLSHADLMQIPGLNNSTGTTTINALIGLRSASYSGITTSGPTFLQASYNYAQNGFLNFQTSSGGVSDSPLISRQDLINFFAQNDANFNTASATVSQALPYLGTFSRAVSAPTYAPPLNPSAIPGYVSTMVTASPAPTYHTSMETAGIANRDLANVRYSVTGKVIHYYDDPTSATPTGTYTVSLGDRLLQTRFSLAKINWLSQVSPITPGATVPTAFVKPIRASFGLSWVTSGGTANGGNGYWSYVGSGTATIGSGILTLDQVAADKANGLGSGPREPNFFELLKAAILNGSLGLGPGPCAWSNGTVTPFEFRDAGDYSTFPGPENLDVYSFDRLVPASATIRAPSRISDMQILKIGANIIDQFDADSYPTAIYFNYPGMTSTYDAASNLPVTTPPIDHTEYGECNMVFGDENLPYLDGAYLIAGTPSSTSTSTLNGWIQPQVWNPHQMPTSFSASTPTTYQIRAYGQATLAWLKENTPTPNGEATNGASAIPPPGVLDGSYINITCNNSTANQAFYPAPVPITTSTTTLPNITCAAAGTNSVNMTPLTSGTNTMTDWSMNPFVAFWLGNDSTYVVDPDFGQPNGEKSKSYLETTAGFTLALGWLDSNAGFHPYSFMIAPVGFTYGVIGNEKNGGDVGFTNTGSAYPQHTGDDCHFYVDPRTFRFGTLFDWDSADFGTTRYPSSGSHKSDTGGWGAPFSTSFQYPTALASPATAKGSSNGNPEEDWEVNQATPLPQTSPATATYYADPDGVVRPGDGVHCNPSTGDGTPLFTSAGTGGPALGDKKTGTGVDDIPATTTNNSGNTRHGRRPIILNRPFRSVGELGYTFRDLPFKTLDFFTSSSADAALLDVFSLTDEANIVPIPNSSPAASQVDAVVAGEVDISNAPQPVLAAILSGGSKKDLDMGLSGPNSPNTAYGYNIGAESTPVTTSLATTIANVLSGAAPNPLLNRAGLATVLGPTIYTALSANSPTDSYNKPYLESSVRALADVTNTRTWNLMIDIIAQSGHMSPTAATLNDFVVEGERRYWLHIAIDRYTGKIVDQQLEPVYE